MRDEIGGYYPRSGYSGGGEGKGIFRSTDVVQWISPHSNPPPEYLEREKSGTPELSHTRHKGIANSSFVIAPRNVCIAD